MRLRPKKWARPELEACNFFQINPEIHKGNWQKKFKKKQPIHLELGCGKGTFMAELGYKNPLVNFITIDLIDAVLGLAKRNIESTYQVHSAPLDNIQLMSWDIERIDMILSPIDTIERIYINFCNPWPLRRCHKKRLTHPKQLEKYKTFLSSNGKIYFKTDNDDLFNDSLSYLKESGFTIKTLIRDLHASDYPNNIETEHEKMYTKQGIKIKFLIASL